MDLRVFADLPDRDLRREGVLIGEGRLVVSRVASRCVLLGVLAEPSAAAEAEALAAGRCPCIVLSADRISALAGYPFHRGLIAAAERPAVPVLPDRLPGRRLLVLPDPTDPVNLGATVRSAATLGWDGFVLGPSACDPFGRRALRCSMGATLILPAWTCGEPAHLAPLADDGWTIVAAAVEDGADGPRSLATAGKLALMLGNERTGIGEAWRRSCARAVAIPQARKDEDGVDSLNLAAAAAILLWEGR
ncbi:MAG: hypothetical protein A2Z99_16070 [Treponema sp. GWB1_62_6]|nr:MAG: hypothetical protein A2Y36_10055 [Treponema sp. GWA1_62_8]OHE64118.1 MAG: hypothetical protein A2Z99_16070 [Treponema sp. GWB1_62_6]OHE65231.1 MAG: hypothetical protein A2001_03660 [Treponema sp. GWC1_61_84]OHE75852.1 MAG: hypothetical protein A2413_11540 [Treponema sp. RIFOXYC1_FULL_61_9]HCM26418.1 rRNA methyltransferase [Treponema sp.]